MIIFTAAVHIYIPKNMLQVTVCILPILYYITNTYLTSDPNAKVAVIKINKYMILLFCSK